MTFEETTEYLDSRRYQYIFYVSEELYFSSPHMKLKDSDDIHEKMNSGIGAFYGVSYRDSGDRSWIVPVSKIIAIQLKDVTPKE